jgi:hypothetical protein
MQRRGKMRELGIVLVLILSTPAWPGDSALKLELESGVRTLRVGQRSSLRLTIAGTEIGRITAGTEGVDDANARVGSFVYSLTFVPPREGQFTFGPYQLSFNGRPLVSNAVSVFVLPPWDGTFGTFFRTDSTSITLGEKIELSMETWSTTGGYPQCQIRREEAFTYTPGDSFSSVDKGGTDKAVYYSRRLWWITPKQPGKFKITKDLFETFPEGIEAPDLTVTVKEPAQPAGEKK